MKEKRENPIRVLFSFAGEAKGKMPLSVFLAIVGECFGMLPFLAAAALANGIYAGTADMNQALLWSGGAALGIVLRAVLCTLSSAQKPQHRLYHTEEHAESCR